MKTKFTINNDRHKVMGLQIQSAGESDRYITLLPQQVRTIEFNVPEGNVIYFKIWETGQALLSSIEESIADRMEKNETVS